MGELFLRQKFATERVKYLDGVLIPRSNLYKSNVEGPSRMLRISPPSSLARRATPRGGPRSLSSAATDHAEPHPENVAFVVGKTSFRPYFDHLKGGVRDTRFLEPIYQ